SAGTGTAGSLWATAGTNDEAGVAQEGEASSFWRGEFDPALPSVSERSWPSVEADVVAGAEAGDSAETSESFLVEANVEVDAGSESGGGDISSKDLEGDSASEFGQYHLEERIAVGGMAEVWRASMVGMEGFQKTVAIKKILPHLAENKEFVTMFVDEAKLAAQLNHENLVDIYDLGKIGSDFFIAMEYVDGKDLRSILNRLRRRQEQFPLGLAVFIAARTAAALEYAHTRRDADERPLGLVHRDVSPRNILISHNGNIRLCDFGVAKAVSSVTQTEIGALKGKIQYMSPEQAAGARVDARSDLYSLGNVLFEMVTGRALFVQDTEISLLDAVRGGEVDEPREIRADLPDEVNAILLRALQKDPSDRYASAGEMQRELEEALFHLDPKPTHGALAEWLQMLFESAPQPSARVVVDEEVSSSGTQPTAASIEAPPAGEIPREGGSEVTAPAVSTEVTLADRFRALMPRPTGRARFWLGVACGLLLALLAALAVNAWLNRGAVGAEDTTPVVVPQRLEDSLTDGNEADERDEKAMTEPPITGSDQ
ncbi:MAG: serine/threonine protein kinase, partial [Acidobacteriota bacterium]|nr:serine/threonine protein kinase [Acidobacteriota bacterium]